MTLGQIIKAAREQQGLNQKQLAWRANISQFSIQRLEKDRLNPKLPMLLRLARALKLRINYTVEINNGDCPPNTECPFCGEIRPSKTGSDEDNLGPGKPRVLAVKGQRIYRRDSK